MFLGTQWALLTIVGSSIKCSGGIKRLSVCRYYLVGVSHVVQEIGWTKTGDCKVSDICVNHMTCAFSDNPFTMQYSCNSSYSLPHLKAENCCVLSAVYLFLTKLTENRRKRQLCFSSYGFLKHFCLILLSSQRMFHGYVACYIVTTMYLC